MFTVRQAQRNSARIYRAYEKLSPWNSKTRKGWRQLRQAALMTARHYRP